MSDLIAPLLEGLNTHPQLAGLVTFLISACESIAIIGTIVPGSITMTAIGALAGAGVIPLWGTLIWAILGAIVGDGISYWIGYHFKNRLTGMWPFRTHPGLLATGERFFLKYGSMSVLIGRFVGPVRALVPLIAGMLGMRPLKFLLANVVSAIGWAPAYMLPGILLGAAAQELPPDIAMHVVMVLLFIVLLTLLCLWFIYKLFQLIQKQTDQLKNWLWRKLKNSRYFSVATVLLRHHDERKINGQLHLALYFIITACLFFGLIFYVKMKGPANLFVNEAVFHLFRGIRTPSMDNIMLNVTLLGQKEVVLPAVFVFFICLLIWKRWWTAFHALALGVLAAGAVFITKHLLHSPRPWGILHNPETFSMPSGHTTLATTVYLGLAFLIAASFNPKRRWPIYTCGCLIALFVGLSRLYLGAHWFTDILAAWLLSTALLIIIIVSFRHRVEEPFNPLGILIISLGSLAITFSFYHYQHFAQLQTNYKEMSWPTINIGMDEWWQQNKPTSDVRASLFGFPSQRINIEWAGSLETIRNTLLNEGWAKPPMRDWVSTIHRVADISSSQYLPLVSPQYLDKKPLLILTRSVTDSRNEKRLLVLRLWEANRTIKENQSPLWVGIVGIIPRAYSWLFNQHPSDIMIDASLVFPNNTIEKEWEWKIINVQVPINKRKTIHEKIMLIRKITSSHTP
jgi:membrane protein DedA with SNARE-associated domain/membrane-associated phospholipid phosphatase